MRIQDDWKELKAMTIIATLCLFVVVGGIACGNKTGDNKAMTQIAPTLPEEAPVPAPCSMDGLASIDLAGVCRAMPQATMGALEAVGG